MTRARSLTLQGLERNPGQCPWRIRFQADDIPVSAFFRPPQEITQRVDKNQVALLAIPILCDLAAEVRPSEVRVAEPSNLRSKVDLRKGLQGKVAIECGRRSLYYAMTHEFIDFVRVSFF